MNKNVWIGADNIIYQEYSGDQTYESVQQMITETIQFIRQMQEQQKPALVLSRLGQLGNIDTGARQAAFEGVKKMNFDKLAIVGASAFIQEVAKLILSSTTLGSKVAMFENEKEAIFWLLLA